MADHPFQAMDVVNGFAYLDKLRKSGSVNMFGAAVPLAKFLKVDVADARKLWALWAETFDDDASLNDRVQKAKKELGL